MMRQSLNPLWPVVRVIGRTLILSTRIQASSFIPNYGAVVVKWVPVLVARDPAGEADFVLKHFTLGDTQGRYRSFQHLART